MSRSKNKSLALKMMSIGLAAVIGLLFSSWQCFVLAAEPSGNDWFELHADPFTGADDTGDGGTGNPADFNYYYVGQSFDAGIAIKSNGTTASNIWVDYDTQMMQASNLTSGDYFTSWRNQTIQNGRVKSTGYNFPFSQSTGLGDFGSVQFQLLKPSAANYGTGTPAVLDINIGSIGDTTESNIANNGVDLLDSTEDFQFHIWADTKKPYAKNPLPAHEATGVPTDSLFTFELRDSLNGEGDDSGVGTGIDIESIAGDITFDDGTGPVSYKTYASYVCEGVWGSNLCTMTVTPPEKLKYGTTYTVEVSGYQDKASSNQSQLESGIDGPNTIDIKVFTFATLEDLDPPQLQTESFTPAHGSVEQPLNVSFYFEIIDRAPDGSSGSGVDAESCLIDISSPSFPLRTYSNTDFEVVTVAIDYGVSFEIDPVSDFSSNEVVAVRIYDCSDLAGNYAPEESITFNTIVLDSDGDGLLDVDDNCPAVANAGQEDMDEDEIGDVCDDDLDGDTVANATDNCPNIPNTNQTNTDGAADGGDACDDDNDNDGVTDELDTSSLDPNVCSDTDTDTCDDCSVTGADESGGDVNNDGTDTDADGLCDVGDTCPNDADNDSDGDTICGDVDNCPDTPNTNQEDADLDGLGDVCDESYDLDTDEDGITDDIDNCPNVPNADQADADEDDIGDVCDESYDLDTDGDGITNDIDNCIETPNPDQADADGDGAGDACDVDTDGDGVIDENDNCPNTPNANQEDADLDGLGDACDESYDLDTDGDGITDDIDNCIDTPNPGQEDSDEDGMGDACDNDLDNDTIENESDNCPIGANEDQSDVDQDTQGDVCDSDMDGDFVLNERDNCPMVPNPDQADADEDGIGDLCDAGFSIFNLMAKPEKRFATRTSDNLSLDAGLQFFERSMGTVLLEDIIYLDEDGLSYFLTDKLNIGSYDIAVKGESYLSKIIRNISIEANAIPLNLDYTFGNTFELIAGDIHDDDRISSFDITKMLLSYGTSGNNISDLNKDGYTNAPDIALLVLNYMKEGESF